MLELDWELFGLGAFLFGATLMGQLLSARTDVQPKTEFWVTVLWGAALGVFAALIVEEGSIWLRLAGGAAAGATAFVSGAGITWFMAGRGWLEDDQSRDEKAFRRDVTLFGGAICAAAGSLAGGSGGYDSPGLNLVGGFFAPFIAGTVLYIVSQKGLPRLLFLFGPNAVLGLFWGELLGATAMGM